MSEKSNIPSIRFAGFTDPWEQRKFSQTAPLQRGFDLPTGKITPGPFPVIMSNGVGAYHNKYKAVGPGVITGRSGTIGNLHYVETPYWPHNTTLWVTNFQGNNPKFVFYLYEQLDLSRYQAGSGVPTLNRNDVHDAVVSLPSSELEQRRIASFLTRLDSLITLHQRKHDKLVVLKKSMLEQMFPQEGESVPKVRFAGFTDPWEQRKFSDEFVFLRNNTLSRAELSDEEGSVYDVHYGDVLVKYGPMLDLEDRDLPRIADDSVVEKLTCDGLQDGDIVIADTAEDFTAGKCVELWNVGDSQVFAGLHTMPCRPVNHYALGFLGQYFNAPAFHNQLIPLMQGIKVIALSKAVISGARLVVPSYAEQQRIGTFFSRLDSLITLHQRKHMRFAFA